MRAECEERVTGPGWRKKAQETKKQAARGGTTSFGDGRLYFADYIRDTGQACCGRQLGWMQIRRMKVVVSTTASWLQ